MFIDTFGLKSFFEALPAAERGRRLPPASEPSCASPPDFDDAPAERGLCKPRVGAPSEEAASPLTWKCSLENAAALA
eukprot:4084829-Pyramimonas_sp.AAC.1